MLSVVRRGGRPQPDSRGPLADPRDPRQRTLPPGTENALEAARPVTVIELEVAAGEGALELCEELKGRVWFRRGWLERRGLNAEDCIVIGCKGQSMEPTLPNGCSILVDRSSVEWEPPHNCRAAPRHTPGVERTAAGRSRGLDKDRTRPAVATFPGGQGHGLYAQATFRALIKSGRFERAWKALISATDTPANDNISLRAAAMAIAA